MNEDFVQELFEIIEFVDNDDLKQKISNRMHCIVEYINFQDEIINVLISSLTETILPENVHV